MRDVIFDRQAERTRERIEALRRRASAAPGEQGTLLTEALEELSAMMEELYVAGEEMRQQNEELAITRQAVEEECRRYPVEKRLRIFGLDITERRQMEEELRRSRDDLEIRVRERTAELTKLNEKLRERSRILGGGFISTITPLVFLDKDFNFVRVNEAYANACQRDMSEFAGHNHFEFYPHEENEAIFRQVMETREPYQAFAKPFSFPDHPEWGVTYWDWTLTPLLDDEDEVEYLVFSLKDVTKRVRAEEAVRQNEELLRTVLETLPVGLWIADKKGRLIHGNPASRGIWAGARYVGMDQYGEYKGWWVSTGEPIKPEEWAAARAITDGETSIDEEVEIECFDGTHKIILNSAVPILDARSEIVGVVIVNQDITERNRAEQALREASVYARSLIEASLDPLVTISRDGRIMDVNEATELVTGVSRGTLIGSDFSDYFTEPERAREGYEEVFHQGFVRDYPLAIRHTSGRITDVLYNATVYRTEAGEVRGVFAAARDITARKRAEKALQESERQCRYLSSQLLVAQEQERRMIAQDVHDTLGSSLAAVQFRVDEVRREAETSGIERLAEPLEGAVSMIQEVIGEVRRIQTALRPPLLDDLGIVPTISWFSREFQKTCPRIRIETTIQLEERDLPDIVKTVIFRIMQEAFNNIAKHSGAGVVRLFLGKTERTLEFSIDDDGQGFDVTAAFTSASPTRGMGLSSMRERAELSGGSFALDSVEGKGTRIRVSWLR